MIFLHNFRELSNGHCSVAELYMTDLCDEPEAEQECEDFIAKAVEADGANPEAWQTRARLCIVREKFDEAKEAARKSLSLWLPDFEAVRENKPNSEGAAAGPAFDPVEVCPLLYTTRIASAKMLLELEMLDEATQVRIVSCTTGRC
jgi:hypothetical protein